MAENVLTFDKKEAILAPKDKVENFMLRHRKPLLVVIGVFLAAVVAICICFGVTDASRRKGISAVDAVEYAYTKNLGTLSDEEKAARQDAALEGLKPYLAKNGIVGMRAAMLAADVYAAKKDFANSLAQCLAVIQKGEKTYLAPVYYYRAAVCSEELGNNDDAVKYYEAAANKEDFYVASHALFNLGRLKETAGDYKAAEEVYQKIIDSYSGDDFAKLAHSRIIALKSENKIEQ